MLDAYLVLGASGHLGAPIAHALTQAGRPVTTYSARALAGLRGEDVPEAIAQLAEQIRDTTPHARRIGILLAHRCRTTDIATALTTELVVTRDLVWQLSTSFDSLRALVVGSVTGRLVDPATPEAYHYAKDLQRTIVRQSVRLPNVAMNLLELHWFEKYGASQCTPEYAAQMNSLRTLLGHANLPSLSEIVRFATHILEGDFSLRGDTITFDGGYSLLQR